MQCPTKLKPVRTRRMSNLQKKDILRGSKSFSTNVCLAHISVLLSVEIFPAGLKLVKRSIIQVSWKKKNNKKNTRCKFNYVPSREYRASSPLSFTLGGKKKKKKKNTTEVSNKAAVVILTIPPLDWSFQTQSQTCMIKKPWWHCIK